MANYQDRQLNEAIEDLKEAATAKEARSILFGNVISAVEELQNLISSAPFNEEKNLDRQQLKQVTDAYERLRLATEEYMRERGTSRSSGSGQGRLTCVRDLNALIRKDLDELERHARLPEGTPIPSLEQIIYNARLMEVEVTDPEAIQTVGGAQSTRIPLHVETKYGAVDGFFTAETRMKTAEQTKAEFLAEFASDISKGVYDGPGIALLRKNEIKENQEEDDRDGEDQDEEDLDEEDQDRFHITEAEKQDFRDALQNTQELLTGKNGWKLMVELANAAFKYNNYIKKEHPELDKSDPLRDRIFFGSYNAVHFDSYFEDFKEAFQKKYGDDAWDDCFGSCNARKQLFKLAEKCGAATHVYQIACGQAGIMPGEEITKRNVMMSRVADLMGRGELLANSRSAELTLNGQTTKGIFMEKARGTTLRDMKISEDKEGQPPAEDADPLQYVTEESLENPALKKQLADMQVLDYLCGNLDRHLGNMSYTAEFTDKENRKVSLKAVMGIDNDCSGGVSPDTDLSKQRLVLPENMTVIRRSTAATILKITPAMLRLKLEDLHFSEKELSVMEQRLKNLQVKIRQGIRYDKEHELEPTKLEPGIPRVVKDEFFENEACTMAYLGKTEDKSQNYFNNIRQVPQTITKYVNGFKQQKQINPELKRKDIQYAQAVRREKEPPQRDGRITLRDAISERGKIGGLVSRLKNADSKMHWNSGDFEWMRDSTKKLWERLTQITKARGNNWKGYLTDEEARELDVLYRQVTKAAEHYAYTHPNPWGGFGQKRRDLSLDIAGLRCPRSLDPPVQIIDRNALGSKLGIPKPEERHHSIRSADKNHTQIQNHTQNKKDVTIYRSST